MKNKTEAAKVLLEAGWTIEEVFEVLQVKTSPLTEYRDYVLAGDKKINDYTRQQLNEYLSQQLTKLVSRETFRKREGFNTTNIIR